MSFRLQGVHFFFFVMPDGSPRMARSLLDVGSEQPAHHLRGCGVLFGAKALEDRFLSWIDQDGQSCGATF
ncbi:hypothetical protein ASD68_03615 [Rhodanobacter sp. Root627]|nr:hypothetical protein ASD68_03615 [Rhodanobacter sp. Root627]